MAANNIPITVAYGDGVGPEIMEAVILILKEAGAKIHIDTVEIGARANHHGFKSGIPDSCWETIRKNKVFLKAPVITPQGEGHTNAILRHTLGLYANIIPCVSYYPFVSTKHSALDIVLIRENEDAFYESTEYRQTKNVFQTIKLTTRHVYEKINKLAFDYATLHNRTKVTCLMNNNAAKLTDGLFHGVFNEIALNYPGIENENYVGDGFENLDILLSNSVPLDILSEISGSIDLAGSAYIGDEYAVFEAANQNTATTSGLLHGAVMMLLHINQFDVAEKIHNAWLKTIEDGIHTADIYNENTSSKKADTQEFAEAVMERLGQKPKRLESVSYGYLLNNKKPVEITPDTSTEEKQLIGVDIFFDLEKEDSAKLADRILAITEKTALKLQMISTNGVKVWPQNSRPVAGDYWQGRFLPEGLVKKATHGYIIELLSALKDGNLDFVKIENLYTFDGEPGFLL